jgi:hypothetical protein
VIVQLLDVDRRVVVVVVVKVRGGIHLYRVDRAPVDRAPGFFAVDEKVRARAGCGARRLVVTEVVK